MNIVDHNDIPNKNRVRRNVTFSLNEHEENALRRYYAQITNSLYDPIYLDTKDVTFLLSEFEETLMRQHLEIIRSIPYNPDVKYVEGAGFCPKDLEPEPDMELVSPLEPNFNYIFLDGLFEHIDGRYYKCRSKSWIKNNSDYKSGLYFSTYINDSSLDDSHKRWYRDKGLKAYKRLLYDDYLSESELENMNFVLEPEFLTGWMYFVDKVSNDHKLLDLLSLYVRERKKPLNDEVRQKVLSLRLAVIIINNLGFCELSKFPGSLHFKTSASEVYMICARALFPREQAKAIRQKQNGLDVKIPNPIPVIAIEDYAKKYATKEINFNRIISEKLKLVQDKLPEYIANCKYDEFSSIETHYFHLCMLLNRIEKRLGVEDEPPDNFF